ncbi:MAG: metallophosphoesterase [Patescibacteria group bacterium]
MKIQIASDLHLEFLDNRQWIAANPLIPSGDVLLLAGDIISDKYRDKAENFYKSVESQFPFIISTMGNHEFYNGTAEYAYPSYSKQMAENHAKLNNKSIVRDGVKFIVSVLWSHIPDGKYFEVLNGLNDYNFITKRDIGGEDVRITVDTTNKYHEISLNFIEEELQKKFDEKIVILTHHIPSFKCLSTEFRGDKLNNAFVSDLDEFIIAHPEINLWVCGHSHDFNDTIVGKTRIVRNPLGYVHVEEEKGFRRDFVVEV